MADALDAALKQRLRAVLDGEPCTEAELRKLFEQGRACTLILRGRLERVERELEALDSDPESSVAELASAVREVSEIRPDLADLESLLRQLQAQARTFRAAWAARRA